MTIRLLLLTSATLVTLLCVGACGGDDACEDSECSSPDTLGDAGGGDSGGSADPCVDTPNDPKCLEESGAIFVSNSGTGDGSRANPVGSVGAALQKIDDKRRRIYICEGTYPEDIGFTAAQSGVSLIGGFDCTWNPKKDAKPVLGSSATPMTSKGTSGLALVDIAVEAKDATNGGSSIALFVSGGSVTLKGVRLVAGNGAKGENGDLEKVKITNFPADSALNGQNASGNDGGGATKIDCPRGTQTVGGRGGNLGQLGESGTPGGTPNAGTVNDCNAGGTGGSGLPGGTTAPAASAPSVGELTADGWKASSGSNGSTGKPGQGGGGGFGFNGAGGAGGAGGCGGSGGPGGGGGGASIAVAALNATVSVQSSSLRVGVGGVGGDGADGQSGQAIGGTGGNRTGQACNGGNGGIGGKGGPGGGGAGGVASAIVRKDGTLNIDKTTQDAVQPGTAGTGGKDGSGGDTNVGVNGKNDSILVL